MHFLPRMIGFLLLFFASFLCAQDRDGNTVVEKNGIALVKPQAWSKPADAEVIKFTAFTDRSARGAAGAGYFVLRLSNGKDIQVQSSRLVKLILQPVVPRDLVDASQRQFLQKNIDDMALISDAFPVARTTLVNYIKLLQDAAARYDSGEVMDQGVWMSLQKYRDSEVQRVELRLRRAMNEAKVKRQFDMKSNADFIRLTELAESDPALQSRLEAMEAERVKFVSREEQDEILARFESPLSPLEANALLAKLKALPDPGPRAAGVLKQAALAAELTKEIDSIKEAFEALWTPDFIALGKLPEMPADLVSRVDALADRLAVFRAGLPPAGIWVPSPAFSSCAVLRDQWNGLNGLMEKCRLSLVIEKVDEILPAGRQIGAKTSAALELIKSHVKSEILRFAKLVEEGNALLAANDKKQAATKFQGALEIMPDEEIEKRLSATK